MKRNRRQSLIERLGLKGAFLSLEEKLPTPPPRPVASGRVAVRSEEASSLEEFVASGGYADADHLKMRSPVAESMGFSIGCYSGHPQWRRVVSTGGEAVARIVGERGAVVDHPHEPGAVFVDGTLADAPVALVLPDGTGICLDGDTCIALLPEPSFAEPCSFQSDVEQWLAASGDQWLQEAVRELGDLDDPWRHLLAVGMYIRLRETDVSEARRELEAAQRHPPVLPSCPALDWAARLEPTDCDGMVYLTLSMLDLLEGELVELEEDLRFEDPGWRARCLGLFHLRDDVECVLHVLREAGRAHQLDTAVRAVDAAGEELVCSIPMWEGPTRDERLWRCACADPDAWWGEPATWDVEE